MQRAFGTKESGSVQPETKVAAAEESKGGIVKLLFGLMASVAVLLFAYNTYNDLNAPKTPVLTQTQPEQAMPASQTAAAAPLLRGATAQDSTPLAAPKVEAVKDLPKKAKYAELDHYLKAGHIDPKTSKLNKYTRTINVLEGCGRQYDRILTSYRDTNQPVYDRLTGHKTASKPKSGSKPLTADSMKLDISVSRDSSALSSIANANSFRKLNADREFSRSLSQRECIYVGQITKAGRQDI